MRRNGLTISLFSLLLTGMLSTPLFAQSNLCEAPGGDTTVTVTAGTPVRVGFCHSLRDVAGQPIAIPTFMGVTAQGEGPLVVTEVGVPLADGRRWFETVASPAQA